MTMSTYNYLDYVPKGRTKTVAVHDGLDSASRPVLGWQLADKDMPYWPANAAAAS